jgi:CMP-N-acetylneuraminic acid synthetase
MRKVAIIPARGSSKRLPRKNIIDFRGRPIIAYTIEAAIDSRLFERVVVSTEDEEIADVSRRFGASVSERPKKLARDSARVVEVCLDLLGREEKEGRSYSVFCCLYPTAPLRSAEDIKKTVKLIKPGVCDFSMAVTEFDQPPHQAMRVRSDNFLEPMWPELVFCREGEVGRLCVDNGSTYAASVNAFMKLGHFRGPNIRAHFMPRSRSVDINIAEDLEMALYYAEELGL